jgi:hypothetical protein
MFQFARFALAALMFSGSANMFLYWIDPTLFPPLHPFMQELVDSGYLLVPKVLELSGAVLLVGRYRVLALTLLWPVIANVALYHAFIDARQWYNAPILLLLAALASWPERKAWAGLLAPSSART